MTGVCVDAVCAALAGAAVGRIEVLLGRSEGTDPAVLVPMLIAACAVLALLVTMRSKALAPPFPEPSSRALSHSRRRRWHGVATPTDASARSRHHSSRPWCTST